MSFRLKRHVKDVANFPAVPFVDQNPETSAISPAYFRVSDLSSSTNENFSGGGAGKRGNR